MWYTLDRHFQWSSKPHESLTFKKIFEFVYFKAHFTHDNRFVCSTGRKQEYGIASFGVSVTTMEEVFMKVGEGAEKTVDDM
jgi:hypothetical protein